MRAFIYNLFAFVLLMAAIQPHSGQDDLTNRYAWLIGKWQVEGKEQYETWWIEKDQLSGEGYRIENRIRVPLESLSLKRTEGKDEYTATVSDQNSGRPISFRRIQAGAQEFIFENKAHDFPNLIVYKIEHADTIRISVKANDGKGYHYRMFRTAEERKGIDK